MSISPYDLQTMLARLEQNNIRQPDASLPAPPPGYEREKKLHERILAECSARGWLVIHSRMDMPSTVGIGTPDFAIFTDGGRTLLVEAKARDGKKPTAEQLAWLAWARKLGHRAAVCRSFQEFLEFADGGGDGTELLEPDNNNST